MRCSVCAEQPFSVWVNLALIFFPFCLRPSSHLFLAVLAFTVFAFLSEYCLLSFSFLLLLLFVFISPENLNYYRYAGIKLPSWTRWELWMLTLICACPWILSRLPISSVRLYCGGCERVVFGRSMSHCPNIHYVDFALSCMTCCSSLICVDVFNG